MQRGGSHIWSRLLRRVCHAALIWDRFWPKSHAVCRDLPDAFRKNRCLGSLPLSEKMNALIANPVLLGMLRLALSVFLVLMLASPWQFAPPTEPDGMDGQISNPSMFVPLRRQRRHTSLRNWAMYFRLRTLPRGRLQSTTKGKQTTPTPSAWRSVRP